MQLITLKAKIEKHTEWPFKGKRKTELYKDGELFAVYPCTQTQPRKGTKEITIGNWKYSLDWN